MFTWNLIEVRDLMRLVRTSRGSASGHPIHSPELFMLILGEGARYPSDPLDMCLFKTRHYKR